MDTNERESYRRKQRKQSRRGNWQPEDFQTEKFKDRKMKNGKGNGTDWKSLQKFPRSVRACWGIAVQSGKAALQTLRAVVQQ
jgi:hypothetical protein